MIYLQFLNDFKFLKIKFKFKDIYKNDINKYNFGRF